MNGHCEGTVWRGRGRARQNLKQMELRSFGHRLCVSVFICSSVCLSTYVTACMGVFGNLNLQRCVHHTVHTEMCVFYTQCV